MKEFAVGDVVDVKGYGRAEVIEPLCTDTSSKFNGRYRVRYQQDGTTYYARPSALRPTATQVKQRVLLCHSTTHYRTCAASVINYNDAVLEVGSHEGECTFLMSRRCRYIVGVDKSEVTIDAARKRYPGLRFEAVDGFDVAALKALGPPEGFSVVLVDIGGIASLPTVAALVGLYYKEFPWNTKIVVKSVFLKRMMEDCMPYSPAPSNPWQLTASAAAAGGGGGGGAAGSAAAAGRDDAAGAGGVGEGSEPGPSGSGAAAKEELVFYGPRRNGKSRESRASRAAVSASASAAAAAAAATAAMGGAGAAEAQGRGGRGGQGGRGRGGRGGGHIDIGGGPNEGTEPAAAAASVGAAPGDE